MVNIDYIHTFIYYTPYFIIGKKFPITPKDDQTLKPKIDTPDWLSQTLNNSVWSQEFITPELQPIENLTFLARKKNSVCS